jgi:hypothetical protein
MIAVSVKDIDQSPSRDGTHGFQASMLEASTAKRDTLSNAISR